MRTDINQFVAQLMDSCFDYDSSLSEIAALKSTAQASQDEDIANEYWAQEELVIIYQNFVIMYTQLKAKEYYEAWCTAEQIEIYVKFLLTNYPELEHLVVELHTTVKTLQKLYLYKLFISSVLLRKKERCTICGKVQSIRSQCSHIPCHVYNGELCGREVLEVKLLGADIVQNPEHKYSVVFACAKDGNRVDQYDYSLIEELVSKWNKPFMVWKINKKTSTL